MTANNQYNQHAVANFGKTVMPNYQKTNQISLEKEAFIQSQANGNPNYIAQVNVGLPEQTMNSLNSTLKVGSKAIHEPELWGKDMRPGADMRAFFCEFMERK